MRKLTLILLVSIIGTVNAQVIEREVVASGGNFYSNATGQLSTTIGEPVIATVAGGGNELTQGFQQTRIDIVGIEDFQAEYSMKVFPNPTATFITIGVETLKENLSYAIYSIEGKIVLNGSITAKETKLNIAAFAKGSYFLKVSDQNELMKTYKILKQ